VFFILDCTQGDLRSVFHRSGYFYDGINSGSTANQQGITGDAEYAVTDIFFQLFLCLHFVYVVYIRLRIGLSCFFHVPVCDGDQFHSGHKLADLNCNSPAHKTCANHCYPYRVMVCMAFCQCFIYNNHIGSVSC